MSRDPVRIVRVKRKKDRSMYVAHVKIMLPLDGIYRHFRSGRAIERGERKSMVGKSSVSFQWLRTA